ncbi:hypothetical protein EC973_009624 [Apophysomyces ossiformis]|uniref:F-box domain-containing protein n=1 Tax=Apophysomyces ossiformis TaxID=679940 RepID=A0A8H7BM09_9FUNG|nr:hypothetical protein EC973_009624 [Apophysomyces ossiformis]
MANGVNASLTTAPINRLSSEILLNITSRLSWRKLHTLVTVCRQWNAVLTSELYHSITIRSAEQFQTLLNCLIVHSQLAQLIRELRITYDLSENKIAVTAPIRSLLPDQSIKAASVEILPLMNEWKNLRNIIIEHSLRTPTVLPVAFLQDKLTTLSVKTGNMPEWMSVIPKLPSLEKLLIVLEKGRKEAGEKISFSDLEQIHQHLPRLRSLKLYDFWVYGEIPQNTIQCDTVRELVLDVKAGSLWGHYFGQKYTNLEILTISKATDISSAMEEAPFDTASLSLTTEAKVLTMSCPHLKEFAAIDDNTYHTVIDILYTIGAPLISISYYHEGNAWFTKTIHNFYKTLSKVIIVTDGTMTFRYTVKQLKYCQSLEDLWFMCIPEVVEVDWLCDQLQNLKYLSLGADHLTISKQNHTMKHYKLKEIRIHGDEIDDLVYLYFSRFCPHLSLLKCCYSGEFDRSCQIYYPNPSLKSLEIRTYSDCLYKLVQIKEEKSIPGRSQAMETLQSSYQVDWYYCVKTRDHYPRVYRNYGMGGNGTISRLEIPESEGTAMDIGDEVARLYAYLSRENTEDTKKYIELPIASIICHCSDEIMLNGLQLFN